MTNASEIFRIEPEKQRVPLFEGKMIHQFNHRWGAPRYWIDEEEGRDFLLRSQEDAGQILGYQKYRLAFRDVARSTDERTMISTILPRGVFAGNTLNVSSSLAGRDLLYLVALLNSFAVDALIRQKVSAHCNMFYVYQTAVPRLNESDQGYLPVVERSARLICTADEFADLWQETMGTPWAPEVGATDPAERARLRAELDGLVAHLYGLTEDEFVHILATFPVVSQAVKDAALEAYRAFAPRPGDPEILALLAQGESAHLEFKATARGDLKNPRKNREMEGNIVHTVAGFLNADGGTLLIGVADNGTIIGLDSDYQTLGNKKSRDGFELFLTDLLFNAIGRDLAAAVRISFHEVDGKEVCRVLVSASPREVYLKEGNEVIFWLRTGNSTRKLSVREAVEYCKAHWR